MTGKPLIKKRYKLMLDALQLSSIGINDIITGNRDTFQLGSD